MLLIRLNQLLFLLLLVFASYSFFAPGIDSGVTVPHADKVGHFIVFYLLATLFSQAISPSRYAIIAFALIYGGGVELIQGFLPEREASIADLLADVSGALCAVFTSVPLYNTLVQGLNKAMFNSQPSSNLDE